MALSLDSKIKELLNNEEAKQAVAREVPGLIDHPQIGLALDMPLRAVIEMMPSLFPAATVKKLEKVMAKFGGEAEAVAEKVAAKVTGRAQKGSYDFDEIVPREGTNSLKYDAGAILNPDLPPEYIPMWVADMDFACAPPILEAMKKRLDKRILGYSLPLDPAYYLSVIRWMKTRHDWDIEFDSIVFSSGVVEALYQCVARLTKKGDGVIMNTPAYTPFNNAVKWYGRKPVYSPLINTDGYFTIDYADLEKKAADPKNTMLMFCSPQNPTGRVWTKEELQRVGEICLRNNVMIVSDEIHFDIRRKGVKHIPLAKLFPKEKRIITCTAPSKTFNLAGNQLSNIIIPDPDIAMEWRMNHSCGMPNPLSIDACIAAYNECAGWVDAMNAYVDKNFAYVDKYIKKNLPKAKFTVPEGTYLAWIDLRGYGYSDRDLQDRITEQGLFIEYAGDFVADGEGFIRVNLACPLDTVKRAMELLSAAMSAEGAKLRPGAKMRDFSYTGPFVKKSTLKKALDGKTTALYFLRYYGCSICQLDIHEIKENYNLIKKAGGQVKVVLQSDPALVAKELGSAKALPFEIICDPDCALYREFAIRPVKDMAALVGGDGVMKRIDETKVAGFEHGAYEGEELQLPACFVVAPDRTVKYAYYSKSIADVPKVATIADQIKKAK